MHARVVILPDGTEQLGKNMCTMVDIALRIWFLLRQVYCALGVDVFLLCFGIKCHSMGAVGYWFMRGNRDCRICGAFLDFSAEHTREIFEIILYDRFSDIDFDWYLSGEKLSRVLI